MDWNDFCPYVYQFIVMVLSHLHSNLMLTSSIIISQMRQFLGIDALSQDSYFSTEQRTRFGTPTIQTV